VFSFAKKAGLGFAGPLVIVGILTVVFGALMATMSTGALLAARWVLLLDGCCYYVMAAE
jgi:hypothetical protein